MPKVLYEKDGRIARITLNRPEVMNAIDDDLPTELEAAVTRADADPGVHVMVLSGNGDAFCAGYDLAYYAEKNGADNNVTQEMPWDPIKDYRFMWGNTQKFMSLFHCLKPVLCKVHGFAVEELAARMAGVPTNQLAMHKMVVNQAMEMTINSTQRLATVSDGVTRHSPEGLNFKARAEEMGWKQAVPDRDEGTWDWTANEPLPKPNR